MKYAVGKIRYWPLALHPPDAACAVAARLCRRRPLAAHGPAERLDSVRVVRETGRRQAPVPWTCGLVGAVLFREIGSKLTPLRSERLIDTLQQGFEALKRFLAQL